MKKNYKLIITVCSVLLIVFCVRLISFFNLTVTEKQFFDLSGGMIESVEIIDGADYGVDSMKYSLMTNSFGETYLSFHKKAPFGIIKSTGRYYKDANFYELGPDLGYSFQSLNRFETKYAYVFFGNNSNATKFEFSVEEVGTLVRDIDSDEPFVLIFTDDDFDCPDTVLNMEKSIALFDENGNVICKPPI